MAAPPHDPPLPAHAPGAPAHHPGASARPSTGLRGAPASLRVEAATAAHADGLCDLFRRGGVGCCCRWWHFEGTNNEWLARCALDAAANERELRSSLDTSPAALAGLVALSTGGDTVGWLKLTPATSVSKLYRQRPYAGLPALTAARDGVYTLGCCFVDAAWRRRGVTRALLEAGLVTARARGARCVEAFPRCGEGLRSDELWMGPFDLLVSLGFAKVAEVGAYPVLRLDLGSGAQGVAEARCTAAAHRRGAARVRGGR